MDHKTITGVDLHVPGYLTSSDPGAVGTGKYWIDTTAGAGLWVLKVRNAANTGWETVGTGGGGGGVTAHSALTGLTTGDDHTQYRLETDNHSHASSGAQGGTVAHTALTAVGANDHHAQAHSISGGDHTGSVAATQMPALTGDVTTSAGAVATTIANDAVTLAKMANIATDSLIGRDTAATGDPEVLSIAAVMAWNPAPDIQVFTSGSGNWSKPAGARIVRVRCVGGGGGGGGTGATAAGTQAAASGGGAGGVVEKTYAASALSATEAYVVGAAGAAGASGANNGGNGGNTTFKGLTASGGGLGEGAAASSTGPAHPGGAGGAASGGDLNMPGGDAPSSKLNVGVVVAMGAGASNSMSGSAGAALDTAGAAGKAYGGGGAGATSGNSAGARAGGAGSAGVIIVETWP